MTRESETKNGDGTNFMRKKTDIECDLTLGKIATEKYVTMSIVSRRLSHQQVIHRQLAYLTIKFLSSIPQVQ